MDGRWIAKRIRHRVPVTCSAHVTDCIRHIVHFDMNYFPHYLQRIPCQIFLSIALRMVAQF